MQKDLNSFGKYVVQQSRSNLTKQKKNVSKELYNSIGYTLEKTNYGLIYLFKWRTMESIKIRELVE